MEPIRFDLDNGLSLIILPENSQRDGSHSCTFQLYAGSPGNEDQSLSDLNNYSGLIAFDWANQEFYYTRGNRAIPSEEIFQVIECIKNKIY